MTKGTGDWGCEVIGWRNERVTESGVTVTVLQFVSGRGRTRLCG